jgi:hypothetical protein
MATMRKRWLSKKALLLHLAVIIWFPGCLVAGWWQVTVALSGNDIGYLYSVEWPIFAVLGVFGWWQLIHETDEEILARKLLRHAPRPVDVLGEEDTLFDTSAFGDQPGQAEDGLGLAGRGIDPHESSALAPRSDEAALAGDAAQHSPDPDCVSGSPIDSIGDALVLAATRAVVEPVVVDGDPLAGDGGTANDDEEELVLASSRGPRASASDVVAKAGLKRRKIPGPVVRRREEEDEALAAYNDYLTSLHRNGRPQNWRHL